MKINSLIQAGLITVFALATGYAFAGSLGSMHSGMHDDKHANMHGDMHANMHDDMYGDKMNMGMFSHDGMTYIFNELGMSEDEQAQIHVIMQDFMDEMRAAMAGRTQSSTLEEHNAHHDILKERMASVLTVEQLEGLDRYMAAHNPHRGHAGMMHGDKSECGGKHEKHMKGMTHSYNN